MKFVTIKSETSLADLSREVFEIKGAKAAAAANRMIEGSADSQLQDAEATLSLAKDRELSRLASQTPELKDRLSQIVEHAKKQSSQVAEDKKVQIQALAQLEKDLANFSPE